MRPLLQKGLAVWAPKGVAVMHCKGHGKGSDNITLGNRKADEAARHAAQQGVPPETAKESYASKKTSGPAALKLTCKSASEAEKGSEKTGP